MLIFGHTGITLGTAVLLTGALRSIRFSKNKGSQAVEPCQRSQVVPDFNCPQSDKASWLTFLGSYIDIRLLFIGSLLPDIIDKPVGMFLFREIFSHGRLFSHTLLFLILVTLAGLYLYQRHSKGWLLVLSFGTFTHLIFDQMWRIPKTLFWPLFGFAFEKVDLINWVLNMLYALLTDPEKYVPELIGVAILLWFGLALVRRRKIRAFIKCGQVR